MTDYFCAYCEQYHGIYSGCIKESPPEREYEPEDDDLDLDDRDFSKNRFDL